MSDDDERPRRRKARSRTRVRTVRVHDAHDPETVELVMEVLIQCQICGEHGFLVPGHHLPAVIQGLTKGMQTYPELVKAHATEVSSDAPVVVPKTEREH